MSRWRRAARPRPQPPPAVSHESAPGPQTPLATKASRGTPPAPTSDHAGQAEKSPRPGPPFERCAGRGPLREGRGARLTFRPSGDRGKSERKIREGHSCANEEPASLRLPRIPPGPWTSARPANLTLAACSICTMPGTQWTWNTSPWTGERLAGQGREGGRVASQGQ